MEETVCNPGKGIRGVMPLRRYIDSMIWQGRLPHAGLGREKPFRMEWACGICLIDPGFVTLPLRHQATRGNGARAIACRPSMSDAGSIDQKMPSAQGFHQISCQHGGCIARTTTPLARTSDPRLLT